MRRKEKEITDRAELEGIIRRATVCRLGMADGEQPYVVPLCFGYEDQTFYFHSAREGRKLDILRKNRKVCFELDVDKEIVQGKTACDWSMKFRSVIGFGRATIIEDPEEKIKALDLIMAHYAQGPFEYREKGLKHALVIKVDVEEMTGKKA